MENKKTFGEFITKKRKEINLTQKELADKLFVTESAVSKWERGVSYPDITLIKEICNVLNITEHELITASNDNMKNKDTENSKKYQRLVKTYTYTWYILYGLSLLVCFIVNLAVNHTLSWFFIVFFAELIAFSLTSLPLLVKKFRGLITLAGFFGSINLLLLVCAIYSKGNWFFITLFSLLLGFSLIFLPFILKSVYTKELFEKVKLLDLWKKHKSLIYFTTNTFLLFLLLGVICIYTEADWYFVTAVPITLFSLLLPWLMMLVIRYIRINYLFKTSICLFIVTLYAVFTNGIIKMITERNTFEIGYKINFNIWTEEYINGNVTAIVAIVLLLNGLFFTFFGVIHEFRKEHKVIR